LATGKWFAVKGLFRWFRKETGETVNIEERIVLFRALDFGEAIRHAEGEAVRYCVNDPAANFGIESMGWWDAYSLGEKAAGDGAEVYSRLMDTGLSGDAFLRRYYPKSQDAKTRLA
jgi:hypothetical protein